MSYKSEFPDYDGKFHKLDGWYDNSWHNDVCPHLERRAKEKNGDLEIAVYIWQDYVDEDMRENSGGKRYLFQIAVNDSYILNYATDKWSKIEKLAKEVDLGDYEEEL